MPARNTPDQYKWRRQQLDHMELTNAAQAMLGPMVRADDDAEAKNRTTGQAPVKKGPGAATVKDDDEGEGEPDKDKDKARKAPDDEEKEPTLAEVMAALGKLNKRLDNIEAKKNDDDDDDSGSEDLPERGATRGPGEGAPRALAADDADYDKLRHKSIRVRMRKDKEGSARFDSMTDICSSPIKRGPTRSIQCLA